MPRKQPGKLHWFWMLVPLGFTLTGVASWHWWRWASAPLSLQPSTTALLVTIPPGTATDQVGETLEHSGIIRSALAWQLWNRYLITQGLKGGVQAGTYALSPSQSLKQVTQQIWDGKVAQRSFTIPEGWSLRKMGAYFETQGFFSATDFLAAAQQIPYADYPWLPQGLPHLEGFLYPDTYQIPHDQLNPTSIIHQMLKRFEEVALPLYQKEQGKTHLTLAQWVNLGSIVEKEAVIATERPVIAGVFLRRLKLGMTLGSDPTVEYGLNVQQTADKPLTYKQVNTATPYNTYKNPGLPPTAIASPGLDSLRAVLNPKVTPYLYFMARYDGSHIFSRSLSEHESAQRRVRKQQDG